MQVTDVIARLADAWDGRGHWAFNPYTEHRALLELAALPLTLDRSRWADLTAKEREALLHAVRRAVELGRQCAWVFGEGQGARF